MRIAVVGAGGVGGYLAAKLAASGHDVALLARGKHLSQIQSRGLTLAEPQGTLVTRFDIATDRASDIGPVDLVILSVKAQQLAPALASAAPIFGPKTRALPFQNGIDAPQIVARKVGPERTLIGIARIFANITEPGLITRHGRLQSFTIGTIDGAQEGVRDIRDVMANAGIDVPKNKNVIVDMWEKFIFFNAICGTTTGARTNMGGVREHPELWLLFKSLLTEAYQVALANGIDLPKDTVTAALASAEALPDAARASTAHDLAGAKPLEIDWVMGAVVRLGAELGVPTPTSQAVHAMLAPYRNG